MNNTPEILQLLNRVFDGHLSRIEANALKEIDSETIEELVNLRMIARLSFGEQVHYERCCFSERTVAEALAGKVPTEQ